MARNGALRLSRFRWSGRRRRRAEANQIHRMGDWLIGHKPTPNIAREKVLGAEQTNPDVDTNHIVIEPLQARVVGVDKPVAAIHAFLELVLDVV
jgi:hypothetical protein